MHSTVQNPTGLLNLQTYETENVIFLWCSNDMPHYVLKAELVALASLKVPSGIQTCDTRGNVRNTRANTGEGGRGGEEVLATLNLVCEEPGTS